MRRAMIMMVVLLSIGCSEKRSAVEPAGDSPQRLAQQRVTPTVKEIPSPAGAGAAESFIAAGRDGILLTWLEPVPGSDRFALRFARFTAGAWTAPATIVERGDLFVNWADFPSIAEDAKGVLFAQWLRKHGSAPEAYDVEMSVSKDGGSTWSKPFPLNRDGKEAEHGFVTLAPLPAGGVAVAWLDGRNMTPGHGDSEASGDMSLRYATVDANGGIASEVQLDDRTCECCTTGMAIAAGGPVIAYRDRSPEEIRDIATVRQSAGVWTSPKALRNDGWKIAGCPVNGPQVDAIGNDVVVAWFTEGEGQPRVFVTFSGDGGGAFAQAQRVDDGKALGRVDVVAIDRDTAMVIWLEQTPAGGEIRARRIHRDGSREPSTKVADASTSRAAGFARMARAGDSLFFTWTEVTSGAKRVHVARASF